MPTKKKVDNIIKKPDLEDQDFDVEEREAEVKMDMHRYVIVFTAVMGSGETVTQKVNIEAPSVKRAVNMTSFTIDDCNHYEITVDQLS